MHTKAAATAGEFNCKWPRMSDIIILPISSVFIVLHMTGRVAMGMNKVRPTGCVDVGLQVMTTPSELKKMLKDYSNGY